MHINKTQLNINHLKMICTIAQSSTVKQAAEILFITQPALTNRLREAERRLNTHLFVRNGRKLIITSAGKRLLHSAEKILQELERVEYDISLLVDGIEQVLRIGLPHYASFKWLPFVMRAFNKEYPNIELEIIADAAQEPMTMLFQGKIDIAMISSANKLLDLDSETYGTCCILQDELLACLSKKHKKSNQVNFDADEFKDEVYITNSTVPERSREYELFFKPYHVLPKKVLQVGFNEAIMELVKANMGMTIMPKRWLDSSINNKEIHTAKLGEAGLNIYWHLVYLKKDKINEPANLLTQVLKKNSLLI
ncbi:LysR family transcriptional regulator [Pseudoalteromonas sp. NBT06-2]|uniref:LysR family transcriptional regulator n=1 Tax=Pseudoalteromonas sp. NBT06-2 TaxID=2025950 RepID=UPI0014820E64|nr:LysR family transcriptional regulator [Pseudoalteromonas sp. NBT06-2]